MDTNQDNEMQRLVQEQQAPYNPLGNSITARGFESIMAGADPNNPVVSFGSGANPDVDYANAQKAKRANVVVDKQGFLISEEEAKRMVQDEDKLRERVTSLYNSMAPDMAKKYNQHSTFVQALNFTPEAIVHAGSAFGSQFLNIAHSVSAQKHNLQETAWKGYISAIPDNDPAKQSALQAIQNFYNQGYTDIQYAKLSALKDDKGQPLSKEALDIVERYQDLQSARKDNERNMKIEQLYEEGVNEDTASSDFVRKYFNLAALLPGDRNKLTEADKRSFVGQAAGLTGDVAGSLAFSYVTGQATRGLVGAGSSIIAKFAPKAAQVALGASAVAGYASIFPQSFMAQYNRIRTQALLAGKDLDTANSAAFYAGIVEGGLEFAGFKGFNRLMAKNGFLRNIILRDVLPEALQETSQTIGENIITESFGVTDKQFGEIMTEVAMSMLGGALGGAFFAKGIRGGAERAAGWVTGISAEEAAGLNGISAEARREGFFRAAKRIEADLSAKAKDAKTVNDIKFDKKVETEKAETPAKVVVEERVEQPKAEPVAKQTVAEKQAPEPKQVVAENTQKTEPAKEAQAKHEEDVVKAEKVYYTAMEDLYRVYTEKSKTFAPKATKEQLENGWRAVSAVIKAQYNDGVVAEAYDRVIDDSLKYINQADAKVKQNVKEMKAALMEKGISQELAEQLTSEDWVEAHAAQWEVAEQGIISDLTDAGISPEEAKLSVRFVKGLLFDTTFVNPSVQVADILYGLNMQVLNTQTLYLRGRKGDIPEVFMPAVDKVVASQKTDTMQKAEEASDIVELMKDPKKNDKEIRTKLCGASNVKVNGKQLDQNFGFLQSVEEKVLSNPAFSVKQDYSQDDYKTMAVMRAKGATQTEINLAFGIKMNDSVKLSPEEAYQNAIQKLYPKPTAKQIQQLKYLGEEIEGSKNIAGAYTSDKNIAVISDPRTGTAFHEVGHFALTKILSEGITLEKMGLLPNGSPLQAIYNTLRETMKLNGELPTERQFQETLLDQANRFIRDGKASTEELTKDLAALNNLNNANMERINSSLLNNRSDRTNLTKEQKSDTAKNIEGILENRTLSDLVRRADELADIASFKTDGSFDIKKEMANLKAAAETFLENSTLENKDEYKDAIDAVSKTDDLLLAYSIALRVANEAKSQALNKLIDNTVQSELVKDKDFLGQISDEDTFFWSFGSKESKRPVSASKQAAREPKTIKQYYEGYNWKDTAKEVKNSALGLVQSIDAAAQKVSPELGSLLNKQMYRYTDRSLKMKDTIGIITNALEENAKKYKAGDEKFLSKYELDSVVVNLGNGKKAAYEEMHNLIERKLGKKPAEAWDKVVAELRLVKAELIAKGLDPKMFGIENYFPMVVEDYDGFNRDYLKNPTKKSELEKLINRAYEAATTDKDGNPVKLTKEQAIKLKADIEDQITARYQRNADDAAKVSSFLQRRVWNYNMDMMKYYKDPFDTLADYFDSVYRTSMMRTLIGKVRYDESGNPIYSQGENTVDVSEGTNLVGQFLFEYTTNNELTEVQKESVARFEKAIRNLAKRNRDLDPSIFNTIRQLNSLTMLGSPVNAINQVADLYLVATAFGGVNTANAIINVLKGEGINVRDVNVQSSNEAYRPADEGAINKATKWVYRHTFFEQIDVGVKNVTLNAASSWLQEAFNSKPDSIKYKMAMHYVDMCFPPSSYMQLAEEVGAEGQKKARDVRNGVREQLINNLKAGNINDPDVKFVLWYMLSKMQPQNALTVPANYNAMGPLGKLCYQFTTVSLRQLEFLTDYYKTLWNFGDKGIVAKKFGAMLLFMLAVGVPRDVLSDIMKGREPNLGASVAFTPLQLFMINEYLVATIEKEGIFSGLTQVAGPSFGALDNVSRDLIRAIQFKSYKGHAFKNVPIFGTFAYNWMFGGADYNKKMKQSLLDFDGLDESAAQAYSYLRSF